MKTFDYESAWKQLAKPMFETLPANVRDLYARVQVECGHLAQSANLNMPWPDGTAEGVTYLPARPLRTLFEDLPSEVLATAARVINSYGHWYPGNNPDTVGGHWKFSNYADQVLALRLHREVGAAGEYSVLDRAFERKGNGISYAVHEGFIRCQCSTPDGWTWQEIGLATATVWERIKAVEATRKAVEATREDLRFYDANHTGRAWWGAYQENAENFMRLLRTELMPVGRVASFLALDVYMVDEEYIKTRHAAEVAADPSRLAAARAKVITKYRETLEKASTERDGYLWMLDHGIDTSNAIYYDHTRTWCFGWSTPLSAEAASALLDIISEFPGQYEIKQAPKAVAQ